jgi:phosphatidylinositol dimannoside acyltransferase
VTQVAAPAGIEEDESFRDRLVVAGYRTLDRLARALPEKTGRALFTRFGALAYGLRPGVRAVVAANQAQVLGRSPEDPLVISSTREAFRLYARYWVDTFHIAEMTDEEVVARVECDTVPVLERALEGGRGAILALPHMGNWDVGGRWMAAIGNPVVSVAEELRPRGVFELFLAHRKALKMDIIGLSPGAKVGQELAAALRAGRVVALVADRDLTGRGIEVEMFGRARRIPTGPALLSITSRAPLLVAPVYTRPDGWRIRMGEPIDVEPTGDRRADVIELARRMAAEFERAISAAPADWHMFQPGWDDPHP